MLYGVSVGCGDPMDMTLRAVRTIEACKTVFVPKTDGGRTLALDIASQAADLSGKKIVTLETPMTRDKAALDAAHEAAAETVCKALENGDAAMLCLGDVSIYTTFAYIAARVEKRGYGVKWLPGVSSVTAAACASGVPLVLGLQPLHILPYGCEGFSEKLSLNGTKVIMKSGKKAPLLISELRERGLLKKTIAVENAGLENECISVGEDIPENVGYFTVFIIPAE